LNPSLKEKKGPIFFSYSCIFEVKILSYLLNFFKLKTKMPKVNFIDKNGIKKEVEAPVGLSILEIAHQNDVDLEGACDGSLACSTCHVIVEPDWFELLSGPSEEEEDMLDLAFGLTHTSRLGCQIIMRDELDGLTVRLPSATRNMST
jgi:2Fe-2S ferredoxin